MFAMLFLTELDRLVEKRWKGEFYGRYVDDMALVACSPTALKHLRKKIGSWLQAHKLRLSPKKVYLQYHDKGILFVGGCIKPGRIYVQNRVLCNFYNRMMYFNEKARHVFVFPGQNKQEFEMSMNSYFGLLGAFDEYRQAHVMAGMMGREWYRYFEQIYYGGKVKCHLRFNYQDYHIQRKRINHGIQYRKQYALTA